MSDETRITVRYWASVRAATGVSTEQYEVAGPLSVAQVRELALTRHPDPRVARVVAVCSVLVDELPVSSSDPASVLVRPGSTMDFLPPFAGG